MSIQSLTLADDILTGVFALTGGLTLINKPASWLTTSHDMLGIELWSDAAWELSWSSAGDSIAIAANAIVRISIRKGLAKTATTIPGIYVTGTSDLQILAHKVAGYADQA